MFIRIKDRDLFKSTLTDFTQLTIPLSYMFLENSTCDRAHSIDYIDKPPKESLPSDSIYQYYVLCL